MDRKIMIWQEGGEIKISAPFEGPVENKAMVLYMLEAARDAVKAHRSGDGSRLALPSGVQIPHLRNGE